MPRIRDIAVICRSKNASPFLLTLDVVFPDKETFEKVRASGVISKELISRLYSVPVADVLLVEFPPANAFKATIPRLVRLGGRGGHRRLRRPAARPPHGRGVAGLGAGSAPLHLPAIPSLRVELIGPDVAYRAVNPVTV